LTIIKEKLDSIRGEAHCRGVQEEKPIMRYETIWSFHTPRFSVTLDVAPEDMDPADSFQFEEDIAAVRNGDVDWFQARVSVRMDSALVGVDYLGGCAYASAQEFRESHIKYKSGDYFTDMVREACREARKTLCNVPKMRCAQ
jgi:hypothetical protein